MALSREAFPPGPKQDDRTAFEFAIDINRIRRSVIKPAMTRILGALFLLTSLITPAAAAISGPVDIKGQGQVSGLKIPADGRNPEVWVYRGIPYAMPPVGPLRWKPPQPPTGPPATWTGVRDGTVYPNDCMQKPFERGTTYYFDVQPRWTNGGFDGGGSEDCLYLNVWTAAKSAEERDRLPVMFWIHGGGFSSGSGRVSSYDGAALARKGVVLVTINYRLGAFGFFAHPELTKESEHHASGNYGLMDQIAALEWVKKNIAAFGGNPDKVTIFGESAGSWSVNALMASEKAKGLFHRAIGQSGGLFARMDPFSRVAASTRARAILGCGPVGRCDVNLSNLRAVPAKLLLQRAHRTAEVAIVDGFVLRKEVHEIFNKGEQNDVPLLVGYNAHEWTTLALDPDCTPKTTMQKCTDIRDRLFGWEMRTWARMQTTKTKDKTYVYYFTRETAGPGPNGRQLGAFHGLEIAYAFGNFDNKGPWAAPNDNGKLSDATMSYWVNFAKTGNPNGGGLTSWPAYSQQQDQVLELGDNIAVRTIVKKERLDWFDQHCQRRRWPSACEPPARIIW